MHHIFRIIVWLLALEKPRLAAAPAPAASPWAVGDALRTAHENQPAVKACLDDLKSGRPDGVSCAKQGLAALYPSARSAWSHVEGVLNDAATVGGLVAVGIVAIWAIGAPIVWGATRIPKMRGWPQVRYLRRPRVFVQPIDDDSATAPSATSLASFVCSTLLSPVTVSPLVDVLAAKSAPSPLLVTLSKRFAVKRQARGRAPRSSDQAGLTADSACNRDAARRDRGGRCPGNGVASGRDGIQRLDGDTKAAAGRLFGAHGGNRKARRRGPPRHRWTLGRCN